MGNAERRIKAVLLAIECIILGIGVYLSVSGTSWAVKYSSAYKVYYLYALLGVAFIFILIALRTKQLTVHLGFVMICLYFLFAGFHGYGTCATAAVRAQQLERYKNKTVILHVDDEVYEWNGEAFYDGSELKTAPIEGKEVYVEINGKKEASGPSVCIKGEDTDTLYYEMPWGSPGHYLVMVKKRQ